VRDAAGRTAGLKVAQHHDATPGTPPVRPPPAPPHARHHAGRGDGRLGGPRGGGGEPDQRRGQQRPPPPGRREEVGGDRSLEAQIATIESTPFAGLAALDAATFDLDGAIAAEGGYPQGGVGAGAISGVVSVDAPTGDPTALLEITVSLTWQGMSGPVVMTRRIRRSALGG